MTGADSRSETAIGLLTPTVIRLDPDDTGAGLHDVPLASRNPVCSFVTTTVRGNLLNIPEGKELRMTSTIPEAEILKELEKDTRQAWEHYQERLRELTGAEYERTEAESWDELQSELQRLDQRREDRKPTAA